MPDIFSSLKGCRGEQTGQVLAPMKPHICGGVPVCVCAYFVTTTAAI